MEVLNINILDVKCFIRLGCHIAIKVAMTVEKFSQTYKTMSKNVCPLVTFVYKCNFSPIVNVIRINRQIDAYLNN